MLSRQEFWCLNVQAGRGERNGLHEWRMEYLAGSFGLEQLHHVTYIRLLSIAVQGQCTEMTKSKTLERICSNNTG